MFGVLGSLFGVLYFAVVAVVAVLAIWVPILVITFLRLRIARLRATEGTGNTER
ncbi:hypothetical protein ACQCSX_07860 [Pseudarthrobacter sp. P1]|uniref:hypothetical protein n=1 Tax=Pseudarthrobacter sp. P1 TaxID=3418418 RepID=UPI003CEE6531